MTDRHVPCSNVYMVTDITTLTIYETLLAAGVEIDHHESDLYVCATPIAIATLEQFELGKLNVTVFKCQIDGRLWFDIPFAFDPWWVSKGTR